MVKEDQKKSAATEKARLKAEHRKIMNEQSTSIRDKEEAKGSTSSSSSSSSVSNDSTKRKRDSKSEGGDVEVGMRVKSKFGDGYCYEGCVTNVKREKGGGGEVYKISIQYDDGDEEECTWPDEDIVVVGGGESWRERRRLRKLGVALME